MGSNIIKLPNARAPRRLRAREWVSSACCDQYVCTGSPFLHIRLGLKLQEQRPLNESYFRYPEPEIPSKSINVHPTQRTQPQQRVKDHSTSYPRNSKATSMSKGKALERTRTRSSVKVEDVVQQLILQKDEAKESRRLLHIAIENLEIFQSSASFVNACSGRTR